MTLAVAALSLPSSASAAPQAEKTGVGVLPARDGVPIGPSAGAPSRPCRTSMDCRPHHKRKHKRHLPQERPEHPGGEAAPGARPAAPAQVGGGKPHHTGPKNVQNGGGPMGGTSGGPIYNNTGPGTNGVVQQTPPTTPPVTSSTHVVVDPTPSVEQTVTVPGAAARPTPVPVVTVAPVVPTDLAVAGPGVTAAPEAASGLGLGLGLGIGIGLDLGSLAGGCQKTAVCAPAATAAPAPAPAAPAGVTASRSCPVTGAASGCLRTLDDYLSVVAALVAGLRASCQAVPPARTTAVPSGCAAPRRTASVPSATGAGRTTVS